MGLVNGKDGEDITHRRTFLVTGPTWYLQGVLVNVECLVRIVTDLRRRKNTAQLVLPGEAFDVLTILLAERVHSIGPVEWVPTLPSADTYDGRSRSGRPWIP